MFKTIGVDFTGVVGPYSMTVTLSWWQGSGGPIPAGPVSNPATLEAILDLNVNATA